MMTRKKTTVAWSFWQRYMRDGVVNMPVAAFREWVDTLPCDEFFAVIDAHARNPAHRCPKRSGGKVRKPHARSKPTPIKGDELCKQLACIAAFNLSDRPKAADAIYRAIRTLQAMDAGAIAEGILQ
jgi:hypothetical protein